MPPNRTSIITGIALLLLAVSTYHFVSSAYASQRYGFVDFPIFLQRAALFADGGDLYVDTADPDAYAPAAAVYKFPPFFAVLLLPFVRSAPMSIYLGHFWLQLALYLLAVALALAGLRCPRRGIFICAGALLALNFEPFFETLWRLQLETAMLLLLVGMVLSARRGRDGLAGAALGIATALKLYPGFLLLYFLVRRRFRVVLYALLAGALVQLACLIVLGVETNRVFFLDVLPILLRESPVGTSENVGLARYALLLFGADPAVAKRVAQLALLLLTAATLLTVEKNRRAGVDRGTVELAAMIPLMLLSTPNSWVNYQLLLLPALLVLFAKGIGRRLDWGVLAPALAASALLLFYWPCAEPAVGWPCARTPDFLGIHALPRRLHDVGVDLRGLATLLVWATASFVAGGAERDERERPG